MKSHSHSLNALSLAGLFLYLRTRALTNLVIAYTSLPAASLKANTPDYQIAIYTFEMRKAGVISEYMQKRCLQKCRLGEALHSCDQHML